ncbi:MAG: VWA domain-containing protein [Verrucomicrobia subdivision 3 bacterium]|nr:VWA domain-containing protein [Limisphaerales bacterium]
MSFAHPYLLLLLLALPVLAWWKGKRGKQAAFLYSSTQLVKAFADVSRWNAGRILLLMRWLALALFIVGLARPQFVESETTVRASGIDIVAALDLSGSMAAEDRGFTVRGAQANRLEVAKDVLKKFVDKRPNDRIGLVAFAGRAYIAAPLTLDHDFLVQNIDRLDLGAIEDGTAIGSGLSAAVNRLQEVKSKSKIVILMTDGQNNAGKVPPLTAAEAAEALKVKIYTIGVGTRGVGRMPYRDPFGRKRYRNVEVDIDEKTLTAMAEKTGGKYYRADSADTLRRIYDEIGKLERTEVETKKYVQVDELFPWAVIPGLALLLVELALSHTVWRKLP